MTNVQGEPGHTTPVIKLTDRRLLYGFILFVFVAVFYGLLIQVNQNKINHNARAQALYNYHTCLLVQHNVEKANKTIRAQASFLKGFLKTSPDPDNLLKYIKIYEDSLLDVPVCGVEP